MTAARGSLIGAAAVLALALGHGLHHYHFRLAALDADLIDMPEETSAEELWRAVQPHITAQTETVGTYQR